MVNINYDTGRINTVRQIGAFQIKENLKGGTFSSAEALTASVKSTRGNEDNILASVISQNFQLFANLDGKPGLSVADMDVLMLSTDVIKKTGNNNYINASDKLHNGIITEIRNMIDFKPRDSVVNETDKLQVFDNDLFYIREGNQRLGKITSQGRAILLDVSTADSSNKVVDLPFIVNSHTSSISRRIRSFSVSKDGDGCRVDVYLDSLSNSLNGAMFSYWLDSSLQLRKDKEGKELIDYAIAYSSIGQRENEKINIGRSNIGGLVSLGKGKYLAIQESDNGINISTLKLRNNGSKSDLIIDTEQDVGKSLISDAKLNGEIVKLKDYEIQGANQDRDKLYISLVNKHNPNQHFLLVIDNKDNKLSTDKKSEITSGVELISIPDVFESTPLTMSVSAGKLVVFTDDPLSINNGKQVSIDVEKLKALSEE